jgi:hypothetical protein
LLEEREAHEKYPTVLNEAKYSTTLDSDILTALPTNFQTKVDGIKDKDDSEKSD